MTRVHLLALALLVTACGDPVRSDAIDALDGESPGVPKGPLHRPGQPCLVCHGGDGPGDAVFSLAGTVYSNQDSAEPLPNALVKFIDSKSRKYEIGTNCAGNFFVMKDDFAPAYPVWVEVQFGQLNGSPFSQEMESVIYREGSCAHCHSNPPGQTSPGRVYLAPPGVPFPTQCQ